MPGFDNILGQDRVRFSQRANSIQPRPGVSAGGIGISPLVIQATTLRAGLETTRQQQIQTSEEISAQQRYENIVSQSRARR